ncbi:MAG: aldo/keto reductase [Candidatus Margulisbacteria bacterium]|nr:aldo/keto reductase [Candidatus Margulisiibacteriota bacterium]
MSELALGTVQLGLPYGISNTHNIPDQLSAKRLLSGSLDQHFTTWDTAPHYGDAEKKIGIYLKSNPNSHVDIVTKIPFFQDDSHYLEKVKTSINHSLSALNQTSLYGVLFHHYEQYYQNKDLVNPFLNNLKTTHIIQKMGVSIYSPDNLDTILNITDIDIIQIPFSIFDQRLLSNDYLQRLVDQNIDIHVRSIFLQGLLFLNPETLPPFFQSVKKELRQLHQIAKDHCIPLAKLAIGFVKKTPSISKIILGVGSLSELEENAAYHQDGISENLYREFLNLFSSIDPKILDPRSWPKNHISQREAVT